MNIYENYKKIEIIIKIQNYYLLKYIAEKEKLNFKELCRLYLN